MIDKTMTGAARIAAERQRQKDVEGWTAEHDARHSAGELASAAACYLSAAQGLQPLYWPSTWHSDWWKPSPDPVRNLEKAGALLAAEIDRLLAERQGASA